MRSIVIKKEINWDSEKEVLNAVNQNGKTLENASENLKNEIDVILASVNQYGYTLEYTSKELRNDKEFILVAVNQNGYSLEYSSEELQKNYRKITE